VALLEKFGAVLSTSYGLAGVGAQRNNLVPLSPPTHASLGLHHRHSCVGDRFSCCSERDSEVGSIGSKRALCSLSNDA
jgi:hypothetical protein